MAANPYPLSGLALHHQQAGASMLVALAVASARLVGSAESAVGLLHRHVVETTKTGSAAIEVIENATTTATEEMIVASAATEIARAVRTTVIVT